MITFNSSELKIQIIRSGLPQYEVAKRLGVHYNTVSAWCAGSKAPSAKRLVEILHVIGWPQSEINNMRFGLFYSVCGMDNEASES